MIIGLDVGGTHIDIVLLEKKGIMREIKVPTNSSDLFNGILSGLKKITKGIKPKSLKRIVLSTTLTTNSIVQGKIPKLGMIVMGGPGIDPELYKTNEHYYVISGCIDHRGREIQPVDEKEVKKIAEKLKSEGIRHVGVIGKFSSRNPGHEIQVREILRKTFKNIFLGHWISGNLNFPRRIATTFLNASIYPVHKKFFRSVKKSLEKKGLGIPIHILKADGGTMSIDSSFRSPCQTILSGPAASIMGATPFAPAEEDVVVLDIGGTTTDIAVLIKGVPVLEPQGIQIGEYKTLIRSLKTISIGIGGDSIIKVDEGKLKIGPERSGPAMAYGGSLPTPTDALFVMKMIENGDREKAIEGISSIAKNLGKSIEETSSMILDYCCGEILAKTQDMINHINSKPLYTVHELHEGHRVSPEKILVLGGPAPYFAKHIEKTSNYQTITVPSYKVANAIGAALARTTCEVTLFSDTQMGVAGAPEEDFQKNVGKSFSRDDAVNMTYELLKEKALRRGASTKDLEMELLEDLQFNMVRGFHTVGKNIRIKAQIKPGLIHGYKKIVQNL